MTTHIIEFNNRMSKFMKEQVNDTGNYDSKAEIVRDGLRRIYMSALDHNLVKEAKWKI